MRKIETLMNQAISNRKDWKSGNTRVVSYNGFDRVDVQLHGNHICTLNHSEIVLSDGGWRTTTTKSRLNSIIEEFGIEGERVYQKKGQWFVRVYQTETDSFDDVEWSDSDTNFVLR